MMTWMTIQLFFLLQPGNILGTGLRTRQLEEDFCMIWEAKRVYRECK